MSAAPRSGGRSTKEGEGAMAHARDYAHAADQLDSGPKIGCFRPRAELDDRDEVQSLTAWAVQHAKLGDRDAIRYLYVRYADNVYGYVRSIVHDEHDAEDVTQHVFAKIMVVIGKYEQRAMPFSAWILRVAHNVAIDHVRARRAVPCEDVRGSDTPSDERATECRQNFCDALADLTQEQRSVLVLRHIVGLAPGEIAERMGKSEDSIHGLHHRGRRAVRRSLVERSGAPMCRQR
jgi:RNA polymerase sigma-70 factor, ECF subfamily